MTFADAVDWLSKLGPTGVLALLLWRAGLFFKPHIETLIPILFQLLRGHISLMGALESALGDQRVTLKKVSDTQDDHGAVIKEIHEHVATRS